MSLTTSKINLSDKIAILRTRINSIIDEFDNFSFDGSGNLTFGKTFTGLSTIIGTQLISNIAIGTAPLQVTSTTKVSNLNVDKVDGYDFDQELKTTSSPTLTKLTLSQTTGTPPLTISSTTKVSNLNVDKVDGYDFDQELKTTSSPTLANLTITTALKFRSGVTLLYSDTDYEFDFRNSTNPCVFNVYGTYTGSTNYERVFIRGTASAGEIGTEKGSGGGTARPLNFYTDGNLVGQFSTIGKLDSLCGEDTDLDADGVYTSEIAAGYGLLIVAETVNGITAVYRVDNETLTAVSAEATFSILKDNSSTINVYFEDNVLKVQNKTASSDLVIKISWYGVKHA